MVKDSNIHFNTEMFKLAREWQRRSLKDAAQAAGVSVEKITEWENGASKPSAIEARGLVRCYGRHFMDFFFGSPDCPVQKITDFKGHMPERTNSDVRETYIIFDKINRYRDIVIDLLDKLGEQAREIPKSAFCALEDDPEECAVRIREQLNLSVDEQINADENLPNIIREKLDDFGIFTFCDGGLRDFNSRGFFMAIFPLPIIVFTSESPSAQAFTLCHELGNAVLRNEAIRDIGNNTNEEALWCNQFAAAFLMPKSQFSDLMGDPSSEPLPSIPDDKIVEISNHFNVSPHAVCIRLITLGYMKMAYYWEQKKKYFDAKEAEYKQSGHSKIHAPEFKNSVGAFYSRLVIEALNTGKIPYHDAIDLMGLNGS
ncbi:MAG: ImmA/IrrE family metallo-endopeptidase [Shewanella oncorhynchi]